jgi:hypothetical protein
VFWPFNALKTQVQKAWNRLRHTPNPSANTTPDKKKTSPSANEDWIENFPKIAHEAEIPVQASQDHIDENNNTAPPAQATEKEETFVESPPTPTETRDSPYGSIVGLKKGKSI